ncbi:MAG: 30S ribosomal protein S17 [Patescibacteria group bacterium]|nr:30S ribosomal protein S17 [Patescibacteria group bacterium]MCL5224003.1 30S ribosomal protein S17 [Patescibacteria group bacterium]
MTENKVRKHRRLEGTVVSDKMSKTRVVEVVRSKFHPKYRKHYTVSSKFKAHDEKNVYKVGDHVLIEETRPISRDKYFRIIGKVGETPTKDSE